MEKTPEKPQFPHITHEIKLMVDEDQSMRLKGVEDHEYWDASVDERNTKRMKEIVGEIGWPTVSKVGEKGMKNAWLLVQHADRDVEFQIQCLSLMKEAPEGEVSKKLIAYLEDRVRVNQGQGQLYGTQFIQEGGKHVPRPIEDEDKVDERREVMGMDTLEDQIKLMYERYGTPND